MCLMRSQHILSDNNIKVHLDVILIKKQIMKKKLFFLSVLVTVAMTISSCAHRDCQGHKKTVKTEMGGWL